MYLLFVQSPITNVARDISLNKLCSAISGDYCIIPFKTIYTNLDSDFIPNINLTKFIHKTSAVKKFLPSDSIFFSK